MTKKLVCLLLIAFLFVSLIALVVACHSETQPAPTGVTAALTESAKAAT